MKFAFATLALTLLPAFDKPYVEVDIVDGVAFCTLHMRSSNLRDSLALLAHRAQLDIKGLELIDGDLRTDANLSNRRIELVLAYVLGQHGFGASVRASGITIHALLTEEPSTDELRELAGFSYLRVTRNFPDHPSLAAVMLSQARVASQIGRVTTAQRYYEDLINRYPGAAETSSALMELGELLMLQREWGAASQQFSELLRFKIEPAVEEEAKLLFAEAIAREGQNDQALLMLKALDSVRPAATPEARQRRAYLRASFLLGLDRADDALKALDTADSFGLGDLEVRQAALRLRAEALESIGDLAGSARAWIAWQAEVEGEDRIFGLESAARTSLESGRGEDLLAVIFAGRIASEAGFGQRLQPWVDEARTQLGLQPSSTTSVPVTDLLDRAERSTLAGHSQEALALFDDLMARRDELSPKQVLRFTGMRARALEVGASLQAAMDFLRNEIPSFEDTQARRELYLVAADLYARHSLWEQEAEALQGRL